MKKRKYKKASSRIAQRGEIKRFFSLILKIGVPVGLVVAFIFFMRADFVQVKDFEIVDSASSSQKEIKKVATDFVSGNKFFFIPKTNMLMINSDGLSSNLLSKFGRIKNIEINKNFFDQKIQLKVSERPAEFLWCSLETDNCYFMEKNGFIFEKTNFTSANFLASSVSFLEPQNRLLFKSYLKGEPLRQNFTSPEKMENYLAFVEALKNGGLEAISVNIESSDKGAVNTSAGNIFFDPLEKKLINTAQNVLLLINDLKIKNPTANFNYIDARFGNKLFYKLK